MKVSRAVKSAKTIQYIIHFTYLARQAFIFWVVFNLVYSIWFMCYYTIIILQPLCIVGFSLFDVLGPDRLVAGVGWVKSAQAQGDHPGEEVRDHCKASIKACQKRLARPLPEVRGLEGLSSPVCQLSTAAKVSLV